MTHKFVFLEQQRKKKKKSPENIPIGLFYSFNNTNNILNCLNRLLPLKNHIIPIQLTGSTKFPKEKKKKT